MGGGDLNTKKSWHPNTIKNQERVWKAEQQEAEEKRRIMELQKERAEERDREELNAMANRNMSAKTDSQNDVRLNWMYEKPDKKGQAEDYLLGKSVDENFEGPAPDKDVIPVVTRRVAGVSMVGPGEAQVDLVRKMREDPLLLVQERERAARAALLNNPIQRKKLTELLRQDQEKRKDKKAKKSKDSIDNILASKLNALGNKDGGIDLAALLAEDSSDSDSDSSSGKKKKKKKSKKSKKEKKKSKKSKHSESDSEIEKKEHKSRKESKQVDNKRHKSLSRDRSPIYKSKQNRYDDRSSDRSKHDPYGKSHRSYDKRNSEERSYSKDSRSERNNQYKSTRRSPSPHGRTKSSQDRNTKSQSKRSRSRDRNPKKVRLSSAERAAKLLEMTRNGIENEAKRGQRIAEQKIADTRPVVSKGRPAHSHAHALPDSLETRIRSNRHNIQRSKTHMNEHFARR